MAKQSTKLTWNIPTRGAFMAEPVPEIRWLVQDLIPAESIVYVSGPAKKAHKSWFFEVLSTALAVGGRLGEVYAPKSTGVLVFCLEGTRRGTNNRKKAVLRGYQISSELNKEYFAFREPVILDDPNWTDLIINACNSWDAKVIIIDPITYAHEGDENDNAQMLKVVHALHKLRAAGLTVILGMHTRKDISPNEDPDDQLRGGSILRDAYDMHIAIRSYKRKATYLNVWRLGREFEERKLLFRWTIASDPETGEAHTAVLKITTAAQECLNNMESGVASTSELRKSTGFSREEIDEVIEELLLTNQIQEESKNKYSKVTEETEEEENNDD